MTAPANPPKWTQLSSDDLATIHQKIAWCEQRTDGEIVVAFCRRSTYPFSLISPLSLGVFAFANMVGIVANIYGWIQPSELYLQTPSAIGLALLSSFILDKWRVGERHLFNKSDIDRHTNLRAELEFYRRVAYKTKRSTGIIIFMSFIERRVIVLADESIAKKLPNNQSWDTMVQRIVDGMKSGQLAKGIGEALDIAIQPLEQHFPALKDNPNEITDHVVILDR